MALVEVNRIPDAWGDQAQFNYWRDTETGVRTPIRYRPSPEAEWVVDLERVAAAFDALFARDAVYATAMAVLAPLFPASEAAGEGVPVRRLDVDGRVGLGLPAALAAAMAQDVTEALLANVGDLIAAGRLVVVWLD